MDVALIMNGAALAEIQGEIKSGQSTKVRSSFYFPWVFVCDANPPEKNKTCWALL